MVASAFCSNNNFTISTLLYCVAKVNAVVPLLFVAFKSAPFSIKYLAKATFPLKLTPIKALFPEASCASIGAWCYTNVLVAASLSK